MILSCAINRSLNGAGHEVRLESLHESATLPQLHDDDGEHEHGNVHAELSVRRHADLVQPYLLVVVPYEDGVHQRTELVLHLILPPTAQVRGPFLFRVVLPILQGFSQCFYGWYTGIDGGHKRG